MKQNVMKITACGKGVKGVWGAVIYGLIVKLKKNKNIILGGECVRKITKNVLHLNL